MKKIFKNLDWELIGQTLMVFLFIVFVTYVLYSIFGPQEPVGFNR